MRAKQRYRNVYSRMRLLAKEQCCRKYGKVRQPSKYNLSRLYQCLRPFPTSCSVTGFCLIFLSFVSANRHICLYCPVYGSRFNPEFLFMPSLSNQISANLYTLSYIYSWIKPVCDAFGVQKTATDSTLIDWKFGALECIRTVGEKLICAADRGIPLRGS